MMSTDVDLIEKGFEPLHQRVTNIDEPTQQGIDGIFRRNNEYFIVEAKYKGMATLGGTADGKQMSDGWITGSGRLLNAVGGNRTLADDILNGYKRILSEIAPDGTVVYKELDASANVISTFTP